MRNSASFLAAKQDIASQFQLLKQWLRFAIGRITPFHGDQILLHALGRLIDLADIKAFVETGTYLGFSSYYLASRYPGIDVTTIEFNSDYYDLSRVGHY